MIHTTGNEEAEQSAAGDGLPASALKRDEKGYVGANTTSKCGSGRVTRIPGREPRKREEDDSNIPTLLLIRVFFIRNADGPWIKKDLSGTPKTYSMLFQIFPGFIRAPIKKN